MTHSSLKDLKANVAFPQPYAAQLKELLVNPILHYLLLLRRRSLCDDVGAPPHYLSSASVLHLVLWLWPVHYVLKDCSLRFCYYSVS